VIPSGPRGLIYQALLYETADQFLSSAVPFVSEGLHRGDSVIAVTSDANAELLRQNLNGGGDSVTFIEASRWYDAPSRTLAAYHRLVDRLQQESLRVIGEPVWVGLDALETSEWGRYESMVNVSLAAAPAWMMCGYDRRSLPATVLDDAMRTHPELAVGVESEPSATYADPAMYYVEHGADLAEPPSEGVEQLTIYADLAPMRAFVANHAPTMGVPAARLDDFILAINGATCCRSTPAGPTQRCGCTSGGFRVTRGLGIGGAPLSRLRHQIQSWRTACRNDAQAFVVKSSRGPAASSESRTSTCGRPDRLSCATSTHALLPHRRCQTSCSRTSVMVPPLPLVPSNTIDRESHLMEHVYRLTFVKGFRMPYLC
jgi:hypothetical protein